MAVAIPTWVELEGGIVRGGGKVGPNQYINVDGAK